VEKPSWISRTLRLLFWNLCVISALLAILIAALWIRSTRYSDHVTFAGESRPWNPRRGTNLLAAPSNNFTSATGHLYVTWHDTAASWPASRFTWNTFELSGPPTPMSFSPNPASPKPSTFLGAAWGRTDYFPMTPMNPTPARFAALPSFPLTLIYLPYWMLLTVAAALPLAASTRFLVTWRKRRRRHKGLCAPCGYDLRASTDRCPECGTAINANLVKQSRIAAVRRPLLYFLPTIACSCIAVGTADEYFHRYAQPPTSSITDEQIIAAGRISAHLGVCRITQRRIAFGSWGDHTNYGGRIEKNFLLNELFSQVYSEETDVRPGKFLYLAMGKRYLLLTNMLPHPFVIHAEADPTDERIRHVEGLLEKSRQR
jgi:hypothetical protein